MKNATLKKLFMASLLGLATTMNAQTIEGFGCTPDLHVEGKYLVDPQGNPVNLHGVMDTPSMWFNSNRWTSWDLGGYVEAACPRAQEYFTKIFDAITDTESGAYCNIFRLHMEPSWLRRDGVQSSGENDMASTYDREKVKLYLEKLFIPIAEDAKAHGLYIIMRPPGVCPEKIRVGDDYQKYLMDVWDIVSSNEKIKEYAGWLSIELANEPVQVLDANGNRETDGYWGPAIGSAKTDFFQPIINKIRQNGFTGIIWVPGEGYQSSYESYAKYPINDNNFGYAIHIYSGWYGQYDDKCSAQSFIENMKKQVPHVDSKPVVITECDWSPGNTTDQNFDGSATGKNYGTWATARTSTWGNALKGMMDHYGNFSITLTGTDDYVDMKTYLETGKVQPAFMDKPQPEEACGVACFKWYKEWAQDKIPSCESMVDIPQEPYLGLPAVIPGRIEAENFDLGGNKKAYYDTDRTNNGEAYRNEQVDIKPFNGGYKLGWTVKDEWLEYTVNVNTSGTYTWSALVSTDNDQASFHLEMDDQVITEVTQATNTGDWDEMVEVGGTVELTEGEHILKLVVDESFFDIDWIDFKEQSSTATIQIDADGTSIEEGVYDLFNVLGTQLGELEITASTDITSALKNFVKENTLVILKSQQSGKAHKMMVK